MASPIQEITVIIPTYNRGHCVMKALESVLSQTLTPTEILVIDDGSTDGTEKLFENNQSSLVKYYRKKNGGVSSARNFGARLAKGNWLAFLDSDDHWFPEKLEQQCNCLEHHSVRACYCQIRTSDGERKGGFHEALPNVPNGQFFHEDIVWELLWKTEGHPMVQTLLIEKNLFSSLGGFDETLEVAEDTAFFYRVLLTGQFSYVNTHLAVLNRMRENPGLSDNPAPEKRLIRYLCSIRVQMELWLRIVDQQPESARHIESRISYFSQRLALAYCAQKEYGSAKKWAALSLNFGKMDKQFPKKFIIRFAPKIIQNQAYSAWHRA